jgi:SAM-dependent methyltransferase
VLDYDNEAARYDATRGGDARADAAADAIIRLLPIGLPRPGPQRILDVACGTGIVTVRLTGPGRTVLGVDRSSGMAAVATRLRRLPGRVAVGDATMLPVASGSADVVTMIWLLHLLSHDGSARVIAEAARVLRPGGLLITTVNKNDAVYLADNDIAMLVWPLRAASYPAQSDALGRVRDLCASHDLRPVAETAFTGVGQGLSPHEQLRQLRDGKPGWAAEVPADRVQGLREALAALPGQDRPRPDPVYTLLSLRKTFTHD